MDANGWNKVLKNYGIDNLLSIQFDNVSVYMHDGISSNKVDIKDNFIVFTEYDINGYPYSVYKPFNVVKGMVFKPSDQPREKYAKTMLNIRA